MSDYKSATLETIDLLPNQITIDAKFDIRLFERHATAEAQLKNDEEIELLARNIEYNGQIDAVQITPAHVLICGHRRRKAVILINNRRSALSKPLLKLRCIVDRSDTDLIIKAFSSNQQRANLSPVDLAYFLHRFREERNLLADRKGAMQTARLLNLPRHLIDASERLMGSSKEIQNKLHDGSIATDTAMLLMRAKLPTGELTALFQRSHEIQLEDQTDKIIDDVANGKSNVVATRELTKVVASKRIEKPAVVQALREFQSTAKSISPPKIIPLTYTSFLKGLSTVADSTATARAARKLLRYIVKEYAAGTSSQKELERQIAIAFHQDQTLVTLEPTQAAAYS